MKYVLNNFTFELKYFNINVHLLNYPYLSLFYYSFIYSLFVCFWFCFWFFWGGGGGGRTPYPAVCARRILRDVMCARRSSVGAPLRAEERKQNRPAAVSGLINVLVVTRLQADLFTDQLISQFRISSLWAGGSGSGFDCFLRQLLALCLGGVTEKKVISN